MNMISAGRKTWCQRIKAAIILEGVILLMAAFILWENTIRNSAHKVEKYGRNRGENSYCHIGRDDPVGGF